MSKFKRGNMWAVFKAVDLFLITTNSTIKRNGALVMGRGIARQARDRFHGLDLMLGQQITQQCGALGTYGLLLSPRWPQAKLGLFQVKTHYSAAASLDLIEHSTTQLKQWATAHPRQQIHLNFPGIGNGKLNRQLVLPIVATLPDNVTLWEYDRP